ncbi:hypothetical protein F8M41_008042 [Gigaspora margarita]|uniref:Uncharacterized protein n=1 Tax=Gigaspora margarita TaxID=4874 RepID=A0A8H4AVU9_GIGMA|nr:hypothetical protein F8M41_008042 [Gigaspora margarita]
MELLMTYSKLAKVNSTSKIKDLEDCRTRIGAEKYIKRNKCGKPTRHQEVPKRKTANRINSSEKNSIELKVDKQQGKSCNANCAEDIVTQRDVIRMALKLSLWNYWKYAKTKELNLMEKSEDDKVYDSNKMKVDEENNGKNIDNKETTKKKSNCNNKETQRFANMNNITEMLEVVTSEVGNVNKCMNIVKAIDTELVKHLLNPRERIEINIQSKP